MSNIKWPSTVRKARPSPIQRQKGESYGLFNFATKTMIQGNITRNAVRKALLALNYPCDIGIISMSFYADKYCDRE